MSEHEEELMHLQSILHTPCVLQFIFILGVCSMPNWLKLNSQLFLVLDSAKKLNSVRLFILSVACLNFSLELLNVYLHTPPSCFRG